MTESEANYDSGKMSVPIHIGPSGPLGGYVAAPPSKNYTTRMILAASLAEGSSLISHPARNDDARALVQCCRRLGAEIVEEAEGLRIQGVAASPSNPGTLNPDNAGAVLRFLLAVGCLVDGPIRYVTDHTDSLGKRPNRELLEALSHLGASVEESGPDGELPILIRGGRDRLRGKSVEVDGSRSSQFLSALLFLGACLDRELKISVRTQVERPRLVSRPLIDQTLEVLDRFGAEVEVRWANYEFTTSGGGLTGGNHRVPGDWPSAAALISAVAVAGGMVSIEGLQDDAQGERRVQDVFEQMGCRFSKTGDNTRFVHSKGDLQPFSFNGDLATDAVLALEAAACFADGTSRIEGIGNLRLKESDRIRLPIEELGKLGVRARSGPDWIEIEGSPAGLDGGIPVECHGDHRIAQMLAIVGTRCTHGLTLVGAECVSKSYPDFFQDLGRMGVHVRRR